MHCLGRVLRLIYTAPVTVFFRQLIRIAIVRLDILLRSWDARGQVRSRNPSMECTNGACVILREGILYTDLYEYIILIKEWVQLANILELIYPPVIFFTKLSITLQFIRIFVSNRKSKTFYLLQTFIWINILYWTMVFLMAIIQCMPRAKTRHPERPGHCVNYKINSKHYMIVTGAFNIISDCAMLTMPLVWIWRLKMAGRHKLGISAVFATGTL